MRERYEDDFEAGMGAEAIKKLLQDIDVEQLRNELTAELETATGQREFAFLKGLMLLMLSIRAAISLNG